MLNYSKYHALGNDYLVVEDEAWRDVLNPKAVRRVCHRNYGIGSDGILVHLPIADNFRVRIWNPDGSEAEKSGNGLRIFARYLWDQRQVSDEPFAVETLGGTALCQVTDHGRSVTVDMGGVTFDSQRIPVNGPPREVLWELMTINGKDYEYSAASIGNPHCVLVRETISADEVYALGPLIENEPRFPNRTNVQFLRAIDRHNIAIEIWERGAGYTLASGSSSSAAAAVAVRLGLCDSPITVHMPGGTLAIEVGENFQVRMTGPVCRVSEGMFFAEAL